MLFLFLSIVLSGASGQTLQPGIQGARVFGRVVEEGTNLPLAGATVTVIPQGRPAGTSFQPVPPPQATTDNDGRYAFDSLAPGRYRIGAYKEGFASQPSPDPSAFRTFDVAAGETRRGVNISLQQDGTIAGQILDPISGEPLAGSMVAAMRRTT